jgi:hypothetical protein
MKELIDEITKLTDEWRSLTGKGHCKDRDFHWYIETKWSYGQPPTYEVQHWGYIRDEVRVVCSSYNDALVALKAELENAIREEKEIEDTIKDDESW